MKFICTNCSKAFDIESNKSRKGYKCPNCNLEIKMDKVKKILYTHKSSIEKIVADVGDNNVKCFTTGSFTTNFFLHDYPLDIINKCCKFHVVTSGSADRNWIVIIPDRLDDVGGGSGSIDRDPYVTFTNSSGDCDDLAIIARHQEFNGRVSIISGSTSSSYADLMKDLSKNIIENIELKNCDQSIKNVVSFGTQVFSIVENQISGSLSN